MKSSAERSGNEKAIEHVRWICVPVAAVLGVVVPRILVAMLMPRAMALPPGVSTPPESDFARLTLSRVFEILVAAGFVVAGAMSAPRQRYVVAIVLAAVWTLYSLLVHVWLPDSPGITNYRDFAVAAVGGACGGAYIFYREKSNNSEQASHQRNEA